MTSNWIVTVLVSALVAIGAPSLALAQAPPASPPPAAPKPARPIESDGTVNAPAFRLPPSVYLSAPAKVAAPREATDYGDRLDQMLRSGKIPGLRAVLRKSAGSKITKLAAQYDVTVDETTLGGVHGYWARPSGAAKIRGRKVLINLPGGAFLLGDAFSEGLPVAIPLARKGDLDIISIDYRQAPEAIFPAASQDVAAVYRALLTTYKPSQIGIVGCSAGGLLTAQALAWFQKAGLPTPGAAGILCAGADARWAGDSWYWQNPIQGLATPPSLWERAYYGTHDLADPLMSPMESDAILKRFPPTLIITATRAGELSSAVDTHRRLVRNGVEADLHVWDGLGHAFFLQTELPESLEAFVVMARFFDTHLGQRP